MSGRPSWTETWLDSASVVARRSLCVNSKVAALVVSRDNRFHWVGYNGPPSGLPVYGPCSGWCPRAIAGEGSGTADYSACESIHAEVNVLLRADASLIEGGTMLVTRAPCINCARVIANSGLEVVVAKRNEEDDLAKAEAVFQYLRRCGLKAGYTGLDAA